MPSQHGSHKGKRNNEYFGFDGDDAEQIYGKPQQYFTEQVWKLT
jgi:hypothetical protein